jgi:hypothetical protein
MRTLCLALFVIGTTGCRFPETADDLSDPILEVGKADDVGKQIIGQAERIFDERVFCTPQLDDGCIERTELPGARSKARATRLANADGAENVSLWGLSVGSTRFFAVIGCIDPPDADCELNLYNAQDHRVATGMISLERETRWRWFPDLLPLAPGQVGDFCGPHVIDGECAAGLVCQITGIEVGTCQLQGAH